MSDGIDDISYTRYGRDGQGTPSAPPVGSRRRRLRKRQRRRRATVALVLIAVIAVAAAASARLMSWGDAEAGRGNAPPADNVAQPVNLPAGGTGDGAASPQPTESSSPSVAAPGITVTGGGDVIGDRAVRNVLASRGAGLFADIAPIFQASDFTFVNLETPLTSKGQPQTWKDYVFRGDPRLAAAMAESGIDVVSFANNHALDQGTQGLLDTMRICDEDGIALVGAGKDLPQARQAAMLEKDGLKAAFLGFTDVLPMGFPATPSSPGTSPGRSDVPAAMKAIEEAAAGADFTFVAWHWNFEFTTAPSPLETGEGRAAIDAGADVVFGHHPHVLQGIEAYNGGLICYSLGNLVFDNCTGPRADSMLVTTTVSEKELVAVLTPVRIAADGQPFIATGEQGRRILRTVKQYSAALGTTVKISSGRGYVRVAR